MRRAYPLSLSAEVIAKLEKIPKGMRSRKADEVLHAHLSVDKPVSPVLDELKVRAIVRQILSEHKPIPPETHEAIDAKEETRTMNALVQILGMRDLEREGDSAENV